MIPALLENAPPNHPWAMRPNRPLNMSTGPVEVSPRVLNAQLVQLLTPHTESFWKEHDETVCLLQKTLLTKSRTLMMHGSIRAGIDLALGNFLRPGMKVLSAVNGFWGEMIAQWAERHGADVTRVTHGNLEPVDIDRVSEAFSAAAYDMVTIVHVETNSGIVNPIEELGKLVSATDALFFVDTACSAGAMKIETDAWHIDIQTTGSHKCMSSVPGLAIVTVSDKAWARLDDQCRMGSYFDFRTWWRNAMERDSIPPFTQPTSIVHALREALQEIQAFGLDPWWALHRTVADRVMTEIRSIGFELMLDRGGGRDRSLYSDTVIAVRYPAHIADARFRHILLQDYGIFVIGNVGEFAGKSFRVGLMSPPQMQAINLYGAMAAFRDAAAMFKP